MGNFVVNNFVFNREMEKFISTNDEISLLKMVSIFHTESGTFDFCIPMMLFEIKENLFFIKFMIQLIEGLKNLYIKYNKEQLDIIFQQENEPLMKKAKELEDAKKNEIEKNNYLNDVKKFGEFFGDFFEYFNHSEIYNKKYDVLSNIFNFFYNYEKE